ncbi:hypothetical protein ACKVMT_09565 [Halobacteriales archaeon Cl-PHB]
MTSLVGSLAGLLQGGVDPTGGGPLALLVTFLIASVFYAITLHLAATFFIGDVPSQRAAYVGPVPALTSILLQQWGPLVVIPVTLLGDLVAIRFSYRLDVGASVALTLLHFAFSVLLIIPLNNIFGFV